MLEQPSTTGGPWTRAGAQEAGALRGPGPRRFMSGRVADGGSELRLHSLILRLHLLPVCFAVRGKGRLQGRITEG